MGIPERDGPRRPDLLPGGGFRYIGRNYVQNMVLLATTNPGAFQHVVSGANRRMREEDPETWRYMQAQVGSYQATAIPEFNVRARGRAQRFERGATERSRNLGEKLGKYADVPLRSASFRGNAAKYGYVGNDGIRRLLNPEHPDYDASLTGDPMRQQVGQQTRDDMIDFDALSPEEKQVLARYLFIWPFVRGFTKWPAMYLREYPGRVGIAGALAQSQGAMETEPEGGLRERYQFDIPKGVPLVGGEKVSLEWLSPTGGVEDLGESLAGEANALARGRLTLKPLLGTRLTPPGKEVVSLLGGDVDASDFFKQMLREYVPGAKDVIQVEETIRGMQSPATLALQQAGSQVTPGKTGVKKGKKWTKEVEDSIKTIESKTGRKMTPSKRREVKRMTTAYQTWTRYEDVIKIRYLTEGKSNALTGHDRITALLKVAKEFYPSIMAELDEAAQRGGAPNIQAYLDSGDDARSRHVSEKVYNAMFGSKEKYTRAAK